MDFIILCAPGDSVQPIMGNMPAILPPGPIYRLMGMKPLLNRLTLNLWPFCGPMGAEMDAKDKGKRDVAETLAEIMARILSLPVKK